MLEIDSKFLTERKIGQSHWLIDQIVQMRMVNLFSVQNVGPISNIVDKRLYARIRLEIEIGLEFNQLEERKSISSLVNFALID